MKLVMIGGYDPRVEENVEVLTELEDLVSELGLEDQVTFKTSTPTSEKVGVLLSNLTGALKPPQNVLALFQFAVLLFKVPNI